MLAVRTSLLVALSTLAIVVGTPVQLAGQDSATGSIRGTVVDPAGARVTQASIVVVNAGTVTQYTATSDSEGRFALELPPGDYSARVEAEGMSPQLSPSLHVDVGGVTELAFRLKIAGAEESLTVSSARAMVETKPSAVSTLLDERSMNDFPLNGRRFSDLALFSPGVTQDPRGLTSATSGDLSFGGIRGVHNTFLVDGSDYNNAFFAQARGRYRWPYQFSTEVVQEFGVSSNAYGAEQGRSGGAVVNVVTKSGSNHLHGTAFYYLRDSSFGASLPYLAFKPHNRQQQVGGTIGGPLKQNKIFFFTGFDQHIFHVPNVVEFLNGSSRVVPQPKTGPYSPGDYEATDQALVFAAAAQLTSLAGEYPAAQIGNSSYAKLDINLNPRNQLALRVNTTRYWGSNNNVFLDPASPVTYDSINNNGEEHVSTESVNLSLTSSITPRMISHFRAQFSRDQQQSYSNSTDVLVKIPTILDGIGRSNILPRQTHEHRLHLAETLSFEGSRNTWKFGGDALLTTIYDFFPNQQSGEYLFYPLKVDPFTFEPRQGGLQLSPLRAYAHQVPHYYLQNFGSATSHPDTTEYAAFAQDTIRVTNRLALNLGVRWDLQTFKTAGLISSPLFPPSGKLPFQPYNFAPRAGFAYSLGDKRPFVIRGGYGIFFFRIPQIYNAIVQNGVTDSHVFLGLYFRVPMKTPAISRRKFISAASAAVTLTAIPAPLRAAAREPATTEASAATSTVRISSTANPILFDPDQALGSSMDILSHDVVEKIYTPEMVKQCLSAGWGPITYRQNTELSIGAWHWNPNGVWSDPAHKRGYFTGSAELKDPIRHSYGYPLPRRGHTRNGGAEHGYSRITDGNPETFWKSNPYLSSKFTGQPDSAHPQWIVIDLGSHELVSHIRIDWMDPYARRYEVQYWVPEKAGAEGSPMEHPTSGIWTGFTNGAITDGKGGTATLQLSSSPINARHLRIWMTESSNTLDTRPNATHDPKDPRSTAGYAIREVYVGTVTPAGEFVDIIQHRPDQNQTLTLCSSIDPWHSESDIDTHGDQTGLDLFFTSGITNNLPAMIPISLLYGNPDDAAAQMEYLKKRGYPISYVEMGEEPDGQDMLPEDYAELYLQFATAMHKVDPNLKLGGPVFEGVNEDIKVWPDAQGRTSWLGRFLDYLKARNRITDLTFMSFEHYPYPPCEIVWADLFREPQLVSHILDVWRQDGLPANVPMMNTESNVTYGNAQQMADIFAALWLADSVGAFLTAGGAVYYHSPIQPEPLRPGCHGFGTYGNYVADEKLNVKTFTSQYHASRLINLEWVQHRAGVHKLYPAACDLQDAAGHTLITAYSVERPDGNWSVMLINKDQSNPHEVRIAFDDAAHKSFTGPVTMITFGSDQYMWKSDGPNGHPDPNEPPITKTLAAGTQFITLPKASVTILRGKVGN